MRAIGELCSDLRQVIYVWNALKTSRKVLGSDMPQAESAQQTESKAEQIINAGVESCERLKTRKGKAFETQLTDYLVDAVARCR